MSWEVFAKFNRKWKELGLHTAAFVSSNNKDTYGPWPVYNGLCTMEIDRGLPVDVQVRHILATEAIDDILIGNAYVESHVGSGYDQDQCDHRDCGQDMFHRGDVVVVNDNLGHYRGEVEVILKDIPNDGQRNLVGGLSREISWTVSIAVVTTNHEKSAEDIVGSA